MELVTEKREPKYINPRIQLIYSTPKAGKSTLVSKLEDHLILELEPGGGDFISGRIQDIKTPVDFNNIISKIKNSNEKVCEYLIIDTVTKLDEWSEIVGTYNYMKKPQGKKFNREGEEPNGIMITHNDKRFETVHELGQGYGYQYSRGVMTEWYDDFLDIIDSEKVSYIILLAHVKDKSVETRSGDVVDQIDINLTGKVKSIYASRVDALGHFYRENKQGFINYNNEYKVLCGGRCPHLNGSILVSEKQPDNSVKTFWENIYLK
jgi:hypothetical protein